MAYQFHEGIDLNLEQLIKRGVFEHMTFLVQQSLSSLSRFSCRALLNVTCYHYTLQFPGKRCVVLIWKKQSHVHFPFKILTNFSYYDYISVAKLRGKLRVLVQPQPLNRQWLRVSTPPPTTSSTSSWALATTTKKFVSRFSRDWTARLRHP